MGIISVLRWVGWNTLLAVIPVAAAYAVAWLAGRPAKRRLPARALAGALLVVWVAFLPNTCYLLTEWRHFLEWLYQTDLYARWHVGRDSSAMLRLVTYTGFFAAYSLIGMLTFALGIRPIKAVVRRHTRRLWLWAIPFFTLMSLGVYLGLVLRFNSWDLIHRTEQVWMAVATVPYRPVLAGLIIVFGLFLWAAFICIDIWIDGVQCRWQRTARVGS
ncbi:MAG: DUF1361 domain-containing protein [Armatimonadetes bacterium]|nr:DUF1361 domain-containing protein [Armatimonadota bacterium]